MQRRVHAVDDGRPRFDIDADMLEVGVIEQVRDHDRGVAQCAGYRIGEGLRVVRRDG